MISVNILLLGGSAVTATLKNVGIYCKSSQNSGCSIKQSPPPHEHGQLFYSQIDFFLHPAVLTNHRLSISLVQRERGWGILVGVIQFQKLKLFLGREGKGSSAHIKKIAQKRMSFLKNYV